jgi:hypothetical protein
MGSMTLGELVMGARDKPWGNKAMLREEMQYHYRLGNFEVPTSHLSYFSEAAAYIALLCVQGCDLLLEMPLVCNWPVMNRRANHSALVPGKWYSELLPCCRLQLQFRDVLILICQVLANSKRICSLSYLGGLKLSLSSMKSLWYIMRWHPSRNFV